MNPTISFCICTRNSMKHLPETIMSIKAQKMRGMKKEILIVDGDSSDGSFSYAKKHADQFFGGITNLARARNTCIEHFKGKYCAFVDSDIVLPEGWAKRMIELLERWPKVDTVASISCEYISIPRNSVTEAIDKARKLQFSGTIFTNSGYMQSSIWKSDILKRLHTNEQWSIGAEDLDLFYQATKWGYTHMVTTQFNVKHYGPSGIFELLKKWHAYGKIHWKVPQKIPTQRSAWNTYKWYYLPFVGISWLLTPFISGIPLFLIFFSPYFAYSWKLFTEKGDIDPIFTLVNGLKFQAHSAGMFVGTIEGFFGD